MTDVNTVRWGDRLVIPWNAGQSVQTGEVLRVKSPFPNHWRIITIVNSDNFGQPGVNVTLVLMLGVGSSNFEYGFAIPINVITSFEFPAQYVSARFTTNAGVIANARLQVTAQVAPLVPWQGIEVQVKR